MLDRAEPQSLEEAKAQHLQSYYTVCGYQEGRPPQRTLLTPEVIRDGSRLVKAAPPRPWSAEVSGLNTKVTDGDGGILFHGVGQEFSPAAAEAVAFAMNHISAALTRVTSLRSDIEMLEQALGLVNLDRDPWALGQDVELVGQPHQLLGALQTDHECGGYTAWACVTGLWFKEIGGPFHDKEAAVGTIEDEFKRRWGCTPAESMMAIVNENRAILGLPPQEEVPA